MAARRETSTAMAIVFIEPSSVSLCFNLTVVIGDEVLAISDEVFVIVTMEVFVLTKRELYHNFFDMVLSKLLSIDNDYVERNERYGNCWGFCYYRNCSVYIYFFCIGSQK